MSSKLAFFDGLSETFNFLKRKQKESDDMDILDKLRRAVEEYRQRNGRRPDRICLAGDAAQEMADWISREDHKKATLLEYGKRTKDEEFLEGGMMYFKSIPVIAELDSSRSLLVE